MKKATKVGIARTLNSARIPKAGYIPSKMVRGYGSIKYGYTIKQLQNDFIVEYDNLADYVGYRDWETVRKSTRLNSSHSAKSRMPSSA